MRKLFETMKERTKRIRAMIIHEIVNEGKCIVVRSVDCLLTS